eukprot:SAG31_NODE_36337_length_314_cov_0.902326_2_plen_34_part_01
MGCIFANTLVLAMDYHDETVGRQFQANMPFQDED